MAKPYCTKKSSQPDTIGILSGNCPVFTNTRAKKIDARLETQRTPPHFQNLDEILKQYVFVTNVMLR